MQILCVLLLMAVIGGAAQADVTLVADGQPTAVIRLAAHPTDSARMAAAELVKYLQKMSGAQLPVIQDPAPAPAGQTVIVIRSGAATPAPGSNMSKMAPEQMRVSTSPRRILLEGCDTGPTGFALKGTLWAAYDLLEKLGVRWLWPGELGEVVPERQTVTVPDHLKVDFTPSIIQREVRRLGWDTDEKSALEKVGITREAFEANFNTGKDWWLHNRDATQGRFSYGHAFNDYWARFGKTHPEWFALQPDGTRDQSKGEPDRARLCVSNPELQAQVAADCIARLKADPNLYCTSISPNDGGDQTFCLCPQCEAWDAQDGPLVDDYGMTPSGKHVSLTDRYVKFYNAVADIVARELPGRRLGAYAYSAYSTPPMHVTLRPNVFIGYVDFDYYSEAAHQASQRAWDAWAKAAPGGLFFRPNLFHTFMGFPGVYVHRLGADLKHLAKTGMKVSDFDTLDGQWALYGLDYYVTLRLLWDPSQSVDAIEDDYCRAGFGPGATAIRRYFDTLEKMEDALSASNTYLNPLRTSPVLARQFTPEFLAQLNGDLDEAATAAGTDEKIRQRVEFLRIGVNYARINRDYLLAREALAHAQGDRQTLKQTLAAATETKLNYMKSLGVTWAINPGYLLMSANW